MNKLVRQASGVALNGRGLLIEGPSGSGKSSLALTLIDRGAMLIGDDGVALSPRGGRIWASPPPNIAGKLEIRNVGLADLPVAEAPVALILQLDPAAPRFIDAPGEIELAGLMVPVLRLFPDASALPLRAEWALRMHGL